MSGPIIRKYGFPNFEKIFGDRPIEHGVEEGEPSEGKAAGTAESKSDEPAPAKDSETKESTKS